MLLALSLTLVVTLLKRRGRARELRKSMAPGAPLPSAALPLG